MSAQSINAFVVHISNPQASSSYGTTIDRVPPGYDVYDLGLNDSLRTLSTNNAGNAESIDGLLFVPSLSAFDPCSNTSKEYIPSNVTRISDVPRRFYNVIALVPWISQNCTRSYLSAANAVASVALITYVPNNQSAAPPPVNDQQWLLSDGGRWKSNAHFPVYAIPGASGFAIMQQLANYSGEVGSSDSGSFQSLPANPGDYIRLYASIQTNAQSNLPSLWAFLLMVLGIVLFLVAVTSFAMHFYQRRARRALRRRIAGGEVDLESLGIRRMTVPPAVLDKLPVYTYAPTEKEASIEGSPISTQPHRRNSEPPPTIPTDKIIVNPSTTLQALRQPTCAICLDDFVAHCTTVKELPCRHIYHPECIDELLKGHSSLCPICKGKVLPNGYCPETITNVMVRRERQARRLPHPPAGSQAQPVEMPVVEAPRRIYAVGGRMASFHRQFGRSSRLGPGRRIFSAPEPQSVEMSDRSPAASPLNTGGAAASSPPAPPPIDRTERARRRVSALLGHQVMTEEEEVERRERMPKWRKAIGSVFPGFR